ncbi:MAG: hypothetical protein ABWY78_06250 [Microvirga sp.]
MGDILKGYNLGEMGVNVAKSPIHLTDGELVAAQNAQFYVEAGRGAIRKRPGLQVFSNALAGDVKGFIGVPLPSPNRRAMLLISKQNASTFIMEGSVSADGGTTWGAASFLGLIATGMRLAAQDPPVDVAGAITGFYGRRQAVIGDFMYLGEDPDAVDTTAGRLIQLYRRYDYVSAAYQFVASQVMIFPSSSAIDTIFRHKSTLYVANRGTGGFNNYLWQLDPLTGQNTIMGLGTAFVPGTENIMSGAPNLGMLFIGTSRATQGQIHKLRVGDASWTLVKTAAANQHTYVSMAVYKGIMYCATSALSGTAAIIEAMAVAGTFSTARTGGTTGQHNWWDLLTLHNGELFAFYQVLDGTVCQAHKYDGSSWVNDEDLALLTGGVTYITQAQSFGTTLWVSASVGGDLRMLKRTSGGTWTVVDPSTSGTDGYMAIY